MSCDSAAFVFCTDIFPFFIGWKYKQWKPVGIFIWKYFFKINHFIVKIETDVENSCFYWKTNKLNNAKAKLWFLFGSWQQKAQAFLSANWVEGQRLIIIFFFFWWMKPETFWMKREIFCTKQNNLLLDYLWGCKHLAVLVQILMHPLQKWVDMTMQTYCPGTIVSSEFAYWMHKWLY